MQWPLLLNDKTLYSEFSLPVGHIKGLKQFTTLKNNLLMWQFENLKMITLRNLIEVLRIFFACLTNQGSKALRHFEKQFDSVAI